MRRLAIVSIITGLVRSTNNVKNYDLIKLGMNPELENLNDCEIFYRGWLMAITCSRDDAFGMVGNGEILVTDI